MNQQKAWEHACKRAPMRKIWSPQVTAPARTRVCAGETAHLGGERNACTVRGRVPPELGVLSVWYECKQLWSLSVLGVPFPTRVLSTFGGGGGSRRLRGSLQSSENRCCGGLPRCFSCSRATRHNTRTQCVYSRHPDGCALHAHVVPKRSSRI